MPAGVIRRNDPYRPLLGIRFIRIPAEFAYVPNKSAVLIKLWRIQLYLVAAAPVRNVQHHVLLFIEPVHDLHQLVSGCWACFFRSIGLVWPYDQRHGVKSVTASVG